MHLKKFKRVSIRILEHPQVLIARIKGISWNHSHTCLDAKDLLAKEASTIIDIGANKGDFIKASKYIFPQAKIYAFEPQAELFNLIKNIPGVTAFNFGLWDKEETLVFFKNSYDSGSSSFLRPTDTFNKTYGMKKPVIEEKLKVKPFDKLDIKINRPCFVKIDVEGAEDRVLKGFGDRLKEVDVLQIEWFFRDYHEKQMKLSNILSVLEKYGFTGFIQREVDYVNNIPSVCDLIFFKEKK